MSNQLILSLTLKHLRYTVVAAELGNVSAAAVRLHVSQPSISMAIRAVESFYGQPLFARERGHRMQLTAFGRGFLKEARGALEHLEVLGRLARDDASMSGEVALGCFTDLAPYYLPSLLKRFSNFMPGVHVSFREAGFDVLSAELDAGIIELALTYDLGLGAGFEYVTLEKLAPYAMLSADHPLARRKSISLRQLAHFPLILTDQALSWQHVLELFQGAGVRTNVLARASSFELQRSMVANGLGVAVAYTRPIGDRSYDGRRLVIRDLDDRLPQRHVLLAWSQRTTPGAAARVFRDFIKSNL